MVQARTLVQDQRAGTLVLDFFSRTSPIAVHTNADRQNVVTGESLEVLQPDDNAFKVVTMAHGVEGINLVFGHIPNLSKPCSFRLT